MNDVVKKYTWLVTHLIWNGSKQKDRTYWVRISQDDAAVLKNSYEVIGNRLLKGGVRVDIIRMLDNNIVLDTR